MATLTATTDPTTGTIRVDVEQTIVRDTFTRVVANGWGSPDFGPAWTVHNAVAQFSVTGTVGRIAVNATNVDFMTSLDTGSDDHEIVILLDTNTVPTGANTRYGVVARFTDTSNYVRAVAIVTVGTGAITLETAVMVGGSLFILNTVASTLTIATNNLLRVRICGNQVMMKLWDSAVTEPAVWNLTTQQNSLTTGTRAGALARRETGNATPTNFDFDNCVVTTADGQPSGEDLKLYRVTTDGVRTEVRGSPFSTEPATVTANTAVATFWDNEAPFDTNVFYEMTSACEDVTLTSNTVNLASDGDGWLRDPVDPTRNLRIMMEGSFDDCVDQDVLVFSGLGSRVYENASGVFDHISAPRPITVSMIRKNYASVLALTSFSLDDVDGVEDILADGRILSLSLPTAYGWATRTFGTDHITIFDVTQALFGVDQRVTARAWEIPFRLSDPPVDTSEGGTGGNGIGGGGATYDALAASALGVTYANLTASGQTYLQVAQGVGY